MNEFMFQQSQADFVVLKNRSALGVMSPIERWPDNNYTPQPLDYMCTVSPKSLQITTRLHGYSADDVYVDLARGCVIILIAPHTNWALARRDEYYCEVPIPSDTKQNVARVEISGDFLTIHLQRKTESIVQRMKTEIIRLKNGSALLLGNRRYVHLFDDSKAV